MAWSVGRMAAKYEYDPYGNITGPDADGDGNIAEEAGPYAAVNPFRFSTKFLDAETGLYYYGYRYYSPRLGRWINRDPIEEEGGPNLHSFVTNGPLDRIDSFGLQESTGAGGGVGTGGTLSALREAAGRAINAVRSADCNQIHIAASYARQAIQMYAQMVETLIAAGTYDHLDVSPLDAALQAAQVAAEIRCGLRKPAASNPPAPGTPSGAPGKPSATPKPDEKPKPKQDNGACPKKDEKPHRPKDPDPKTCTCVCPLVGDVPKSCPQFASATTKGNRGSTIDAARATLPEHCRKYLKHCQCWGGTCGN
ncbi:MAG: RHS repeat-associated core domain-containing protein [Phycisphaerales bacterium]|nr:RHS repeat-associated core domain-containing protein [Phycisphaerales bacterium]